MQKHIVIIGGGFAGLWSAVSAARRLDELHLESRITLVNKDAWHSIRVRNYEDDLSDTIIPLFEVLAPIGVGLQIGTVTHIDSVAHIVHVDGEEGIHALHYDQLILASGSRLVRPPIEGLAEFAFDIDTHAAATRLKHHISNLAQQPAGPGQFTALVIGAGATGVELATELPDRLRAAAAAAGTASEIATTRVILADSKPHIAAGLGGAQSVIARACIALGIELKPDFELAQVDPSGVTLTDGSKIAAATVIWCGGMQADSLAASIPGTHDALGRLDVDAFMRVRGVPAVFAAGDTAHALIDEVHSSVMSCQHARPMGRYAGTNAVNALFGLPLLKLKIDWYTNIIDLGAWGAVYTQGWERKVVATGEQAKKTKAVINRERIVPPRNGSRAAILAAGSTEIQAPPVLPPLCDPA